MAQELTVRNVSFEGNLHIKSDVLKNIIKIRNNKSFDNKLLRFDRILLNNYYQQLGFLDVWIDPNIKRRGNDIDVTYHIREGKQFRLGGIEITGGERVSNSNLKINFELKEGDIYQKQIIENGLNTIENWYYNNGKPYIKIIDQELQKDSLIFVQVDITENETVNISDITFSGLKKVRSYIILRELEIKKNELYSRENIEKSQKNIYSTGLFDFVGLELEANNTDRTKATLIVKVVEKKPRWLGLKFGVAYEQETLYGGTFDFTLEFGHRNLFGSSRTIYFNIIPSLSYDFNKNDIINPKNQFSLTYVEPWIGFTKTPGVIQTAYFQVRPIHSADYNYFTSSFSVKHEFSDSRILSGIIAFDRVNILENDSLGQEFFTQTQGQDFIYSITPGYLRDTRDNYLQPQYGSVTNAAIKFAYSRSRDQLNQQALANQFIKFMFSWNRYQRFPMHKKWILASRIKTGNIIEFGTNTVVPKTERFYLGGASSVRGYSEQLLGPSVYDSITGQKQALGGKFLLLTNLELRIPLFWIMWGELFFDAGNIYKRHTEFKPKSIKTTSGVGVAFITPLGPIRFDYGRKHQPEKLESKGEFHISISFAF